jgi:hypothetical protein
VRLLSTFSRLLPRAVCRGPEEEEAIQNIVSIHYTASAADPATRAAQFRNRRVRIEMTRPMAIPVARAEEPP